MFYVSRLRWGSKLLFQEIEQSYSEKNLTEFKKFHIYEYILYKNTIDTGSFYTRSIIQ